MTIEDKPDESLLRQADVLQRIRISPSAFKRAIDAGKIKPGIRISARTKCWRKSYIDQLVEGLANGSVTL